MLSECVAVVHIVIYSKLDSNGGPLTCCGIEGIVGILEVSDCKITVITVSVVNANNSAGGVVHSESDTVSLTVILLVKCTCFNTVRGGSEVKQASGIFADEISVKVDVICTTYGILELTAHISTSVSIGSLIGNIRLSNSSIYINSRR